jgi:hypothetical protein
VAVLIPPEDWHLHAPGPRHYTEVECPTCGWSWEVEGHYEYGLWVPEREDDLECPVCLEYIEQ